MSEIEVAIPKMINDGLLIFRLECAICEASIFSAVCS